MRRLDRSIVPPPACLSGYHHSRNCWDDVSAASKAEIRKSLEAMQGRKCAYCEGPLDSLGHHIEHFRRRHDFPHLTFDWSNLFWSCDQPDSCGRYKDGKAGRYNVNDLIDPCIDDPDRFFRFRSDGTISIRPGLSPADVRRAQETLRVFNLNPEGGRLRNMRRTVVSPYVSMVDGVDFSAEELKEFFAEELRNAADLPFFTAIRHVLTEP